jgi:uncharacterized protein (DUF1330 family)
MATAVVQHRVKDYTAWRRVYDEAQPMVKGAGGTWASVHQVEGDPNMVLVISKFGTLSQARDFFGNPKLRDAMKRGGVEEKTLRIEYYEDA